MRKVRGEKSEAEEAAKPAEENNPQQEPAPTPTPKPPPELKSKPPKGNRWRWLKALLGFALLGGAGAVFYSNTVLLEQGHTLSTFGAYLPLGLGFLSLVCFVWAMGGGMKPRAAKEAKGEAQEDSSGGIVVDIVRPCSFTDCPTNFRFEGAGKCGSNGMRPKHCRLSEEDFKSLFSPDAHLTH